MASWSSRSTCNVIGYYGSWAHYREGSGKFTVDDIPAQQCTHLIYAFATLNEQSFKVQPSDSWLDIDLKNYEKFIQLKRKNPQLKVLLGVGGWTDSQSDKYSRMAANPTNRGRFVKGVLELLRTYGFDGLDLDWEYPKREDKECFIHLVEELKNAFNPHNLLLTAAVSASKNVIDSGYDVPRIAKNLDLINVMTYDFHGTWEGTVAHHAPLHAVPGDNSQYCADFAVNYWITKGAPAHKIVMGVPFYGNSWTLSGSGNRPGASASGPGKPGKYTKQGGNLSFLEIALAHRDEGWTKKKSDGGSYLTKGNQWVGYDDIEAVTKKAQYALNRGLGGIMVWDLASDDFNNICGHGQNPLLTAISTNL